MTFVIFGTILTLLFLGQQMRFLIDLATILSFLTAPFIAVLNFKLIYFAIINISNFN